MASEITRVLMKSLPLGVDVDNKNQFRVLQVYYNLKYMFPHADVRIYETSKGFHVVAFGVKTNLDVRRTLGDDARRVELSELRGGDDVLFYKKRRRGSEWKEREEISVLSKPFWFVKQCIKRI